MAENLIRTKQINQADLSGAVQNVIDSNSYQITYGGTGININNVGQIIVSGTDIYLIDSIFNVSGTGTFTALDLNNVDTLNLSGVTIDIQAADVTLGNNLNVSGNLTVAGTIKYNEVIDVTTTGNISGYTGYFQNLYANNLVYNSGDQIISGFKDFRNGIYLNNENDVVSFGTKIIGNISGIQLATFQNPTNITIRNDFVGGNYDEVISVHNSPYTDSIFGQSINSSTFGDQIVIYQTGSSFGVPLSKGPYLRLGENNIISEKSSSKLGIGTTFPTEKVHISGGNLRVEGDAIANNLVYNTGNQSITGIKTFNSNVIVPNLADQFPPSSGIRRYYPEGVGTIGSVLPSSGWVQYFPFLIKKDITNYNLCIEALSTTATNIRLGIYSAASGIVNAPLIWTGTLNTSAIQIYRTTPSIPLTKGAYIFASCNTGLAVPASYRSMTVNTTRSSFGEPTGNTTFSNGVANPHYYSVLNPAPNLDLLPRITGEVIVGTAVSPLVLIEY